jgi:nucleoside-diphosphate-sugar epimerase
VLQRAAGTTAEVEFEPLRPGELRASALDSSRIGRVLGWKPLIDLASGLEATLGWYRAAADAAGTE